MTILPEHIAELTRELQTNRAYGEVTLHFQDGKIIQVTDKLTHRPEAIVTAFDESARSKRKQIFVVNRKRKVEAVEDATDQV